VGKKEFLQKKIERLERYAKFYLNILLAILSGIVGSVYALLTNKAHENILILAVLGAVVVIFIVLKIQAIDLQEDELLKELEKEE